MIEYISKKKMYVCRPIGVLLRTVVKYTQKNDIFAAKEIIRINGDVKNYK